MKPSSLKRPRTDRNAGFALVEVLAALALTAALVAVMLPFACRLVERSGSGEGLTQNADAWMRLTARLSADLAQAIPLPGDRQTRLMFRAGRDGVVFVRPPRTGSENSGLQITAYMIERTSAGDALINYAANFSPSLMEADPRSFGAATAVMTGPFRFVFVAVGADGSRPDEWFDRRDLPLRIELTATPLGSSAAPVAPLILPIIAQAQKGNQTSRTAAR